MDNLEFDPFAELPRCDLCGASTVRYTTVLTDKQYSPSVTHQIQFACRAEWSTLQEQPHRNSHQFPNEEYTTTATKRPYPWKEDRACLNASRVARRLRAEAENTE